HGDHAAFGEKGLDPQVGVDTGDFRIIDSTVGVGGDAAVVNSFADELTRNRMLQLLCLRNSQVTRGAQVSGDLVRQHFSQTEAEEVRRVPAVGAGVDIASGTGGAAWASVASGTAIGESCANGAISVDVAYAITLVRTLALRLSELALEKLAPTPDG